MAIKTSSRTAHLVAKHGLTMRPHLAELEGLNARSCDILRLIVDNFVETGEPVGSRTISRKLGAQLSPATVRNIMADLEEAGLLYAPHQSAGRLPTDIGLRLFVDGLLQSGCLDDEERKQIEASCQTSGHSMPEVLEQAIGALSGLSGCVGLVVAPKEESPLRHIELVRLSNNRALAILVSQNGVVENRILDLPRGLPSSSLTEASNYLSDRLVGRTLDQARQDILAEIEDGRAQLDSLTGKVVEAGLATRIDCDNEPLLIVSGRQNLLDDVAGLQDLERVRAIFSLLEKRESILHLLEAVGLGEGVQIYIGAESQLFDLAGFSLIISTFRNSQEKIIGAIGVIGPTRIQYARIIPAVDFTARIIGRIVGSDIAWDD